MLTMDPTAWHTLDTELATDMELDMDLDPALDTEVLAIHILATLGLASALPLRSHLVLASSPLLPSTLLDLALLPSMLSEVPTLVPEVMLPTLRELSMLPREQPRLMLTMDHTPWATLDMEQDLELDMDLDMDTWVLVTQRALATLVTVY